MMDIPRQRRYRFGPFILDARGLWQDGRLAMRMGQPLRVLEYLIARPRMPVERQEVLSAVWSGRIVEDRNLTVAVSSLRRESYREYRRAS